MQVANIMLICDANQKLRRIIISSLLSFYIFNIIGKEHSKNHFYLLDRLYPAYFHYVCVISP